MVELGVQSQLVRVHIPRSLLLKDFVLMKAKGIFLTMESITQTFQKRPKEADPWPLGPDQCQFCSCVQLFMTPRTVACQALLLKRLRRQEYQSIQPFPSPGDLPDPGMEPRSPELQADFLPSEPVGKSCYGPGVYCNRLLCDALGFLGSSNSKESACNAGDNPWIGKILWRRTWQPTPVFLLGEFHGQSSLEGYSPRGHKESDTTEQVTLSLSCHANAEEPHRHGQRASSTSDSTQLIQNRKSHTY